MVALSLASWTLSRVMLVLLVGERIAPGEDRTEENDHTDNGHAHRAQTALRRVEADAR